MRLAGTALAMAAALGFAACSGGHDDDGGARAATTTRARGASEAAQVSAGSDARFRRASRVRVEIRRPASAGLIVRFPASGVTVRRSGSTLVARSAEGAPTLPLCRLRGDARSIVIAADSDAQQLVAGCGGRARPTTVRLVPETRVQAARDHLASVRTRPFVPRVFAADSVWNAPLRADAALDARSAGYVADLRRQLAATTAYVNTTQFSIPVYTVGPHQRTVRVQPDAEAAGVPELRRAFAKVPIPDDARVSGGSDRNIVVYQPSSDTLWELYLGRRDASGWHARWGGRLSGVSGNPGHFTGRDRLFGASATSLAVLGGLIRIPELQRGRIDHALALALPQTRAKVFSLPAQRTDGRIDSPGAIPQGTHFRLDPKLDLSTLNMSPTVRAMAVAAQRYGIVIRDTSGAVSFYAEDPARLGRDPYAGAGGLFHTDDIAKALNTEFPWDHLQALKTELR